MNLIFMPNWSVALLNTAQAAIISIAIVFSGTTLAGPGHDHGDALPAATGSASPRISSHSDLFELVGVVQAGEMKIFLDRYATNEPVTDARIEVEAGTAKGTATPAADGSYSFKNALFDKPGTVPVSFTVVAGQDSDLLAGDLVMADRDAGHSDEAAKRPWLRWAAYAAGVLLVMVVAVAFVRARKRRSNPVIAIVLIAFLAVLVGATASFDAKAGEGHDHGDAAPAASGNAPKRLPDGSVFLPKTSQRQLAVRTVMVEEKSLPQTVELTGRVVADANASGKVQPTQAGRVEAAPRGLPTLGQTVRKGEVLAVVRTSVGAIEKANQQAQNAELRASLDLARRRVARLEQLEGTVPAKEIEEARSVVVSLQQRAAAVGASVSTSESLVAPVSGVITTANVVAGQVVDAREVLFEIVDTSRLGVQASAFDATLLANIASATAITGSSAAPGTSVPLQLTGSSRALREGALVLLFRTVGKDTISLAIDQPVKVIVQTKTQVKGFAVPTAAVVKNPSNQDMVWIHTGAEQFAPRTVRALPLDGSTVSVVDGLKAGDRVVTQGAPLVNQVR